MLLIIGIFLAVMSAVCGVYGFREIQSVTRTAARVCFAIFLVAAVIVFIID